jgi:hypothetical protein
MDRRYRVELIGISPLLMHFDNIPWADAIGEPLTVPSASATPTEGLED